MGGEYVPIVYMVASNVLEPYLGPSIVAHNLLKGFVKIESELKKQDVEIKFISLTPDSLGETIEISDMIKVINTKRVPPITFTGEIQALWNSMKLESPDVLHSHDLYELFPGVIKKIPTVYTLHGIFWREKMFSSSTYMSIYYKLAEKRLRIYYKRLAKLVAISPYVSWELLSKGFDVTKVEVIENPVSDEFFNVKKREENLILYPATITPRKNQLTFLRAVSLIKDEIRDFDIIFTGLGNPTYKKQLQTFVQKNGLRNVKFLGKVPFNELLKLYSRASIVSVVSKEETFLMVLSEAMSTGTPIIVTPKGIAPYVIQDWKTGFLVNPENPVEIAEKLKILLDDKKLRQKMGRNARKIAENRWRSEIIALKHLELYLSILDGGELNGRD